MAERPAQVALSHQMLDAMLDGGIALCDAGTGIGKTYAYLVAGTVYHRFRAAGGRSVKPILISTSSIALHFQICNHNLLLAEIGRAQSYAVWTSFRSLACKTKNNSYVDWRRAGKNSLSII